MKRYGQLAATMMVHSCPLEEVQPQAKIPDHHAARMLMGNCKQDLAFGLPKAMRCLMAGKGLKARRLGFKVRTPPLHMV